MNRTVLLLLFMLATAAFVPRTALLAADVSQTERLSVAELQAKALAGNLDLRKARAAVDDAAEELPWDSELEKARLSASGSQGYSPNEPFVLDPQLQAGVSVPVVPQLSLGISASSRGTLGASVSLSPFAAGATRYREEEQYRRAVLEAAYRAAIVGYDVEAAAYGVVAAQAALSLAQATREYQEDRMAASERAYELGELTYDEVEDVRSDLTTARQGLFDAQRRLLNAQAGLYRLLGPEAGRVGVEPVDAEEILRLIRRRDDELFRIGQEEPRSLTLDTMAVHGRRMEAELAATPVYRPDLKISADLEYPEWAIGGSLSFSFSPNDLNADARAELADAIHEHRMEMELERMALEYQVDILWQSLEVARAALSGDRQALREAQTLRAEAEVLLGQGRRTQLELRQADLAVMRAELNVFSAAVSVLSAQADLLLAYGG